MKIHARNTANGEWKESEPDAVEQHVVRSAFPNESFLDPAEQ